MFRIGFISILVGISLFASSAEELIDQNGCLSCHGVASKKFAPAFAGIGMKNKRFEGEEAKATIMSSIKNGSQGKYRRFSHSSMPAFNNFTSDELSTIADYILSQSSKAKRHGGMMGGRGKGMQ